MSVSSASVVSEGEEGKATASSPARRGIGLLADVTGDDGGSDAGPVDAVARLKAEEKRLEFKRRVRIAARREPKLRSEFDVKTLIEYLQNNVFASQLTPLQQQEMARRLRHVKLQVRVGVRLRDERAATYARVRVAGSDTR